MPEKLEKKPATQVKKQQNSDTDRQTANEGSGHKKTLWLEGKAMTEESSVDKQSLSPGFCVSNVKSGPTITVVVLHLHSYISALADM
jgi:hypothetical protein